MLHISRWKIVLICLVCFYGLAYSAPNLISVAQRQWVADNLPSWAPQKVVNLGLDLRGGAHLLYQIDMDGVFTERYDALVEEFKTLLMDGGIEGARVVATAQGVEVSLPHDLQRSDAKAILRKSDPRLLVRDVVGGDGVTAVFDDISTRDIRTQTISQVIEVVRRRVDEMGTTEPVILRQGDDRVVVQVPGADSGELRKLVGKTAKLGFHLVGDSGRRRVSELTLSYADEPMREINVKRRAIITGDMLEIANASYSQAGQPVVSFRLNAVGARKFCDVTRKNVNKPFAIVLDNEVISAPVINEPICGGSGQISGSFDVQGANDLALLLRAGALPADLTVVEERTVGPSLGADSVAAGKVASLIGLVLVLVFMPTIYSVFGLLANVALVVNIALIIALLSSLQATLTLPGIAGIVLTVGMAVDANVLIFERIREEIANGRTPLSAVDAGYSRAMSTIIDSNFTTLIAAAILFSFGTGPVKGFAVTLGIGIMTSLFSAIMVTRLLVVLWLRNKKPKTLPI